VRTSGRMEDVGIVGAGPGGLATAAMLAASGLRVRVYESAPVVGGRCGRIEEGGYAFDRGPTFFMMPYVLGEVFQAAGRRMEDYVEMVRLDPMYRLLMGREGDGKGGGKSGGEPLRLDATQDIDEMARRIGAIDEEDGRAFRPFIEHNRYKLRHSESILRNPMRSPLDLFSRNTWLDTLKVAPVLNPHLSVHQLLSKYFRNPFVRLAVSFQSKYLGMSPYDCPSLFTILPFIEYEYGVWHPVGGCNALMKALAEVSTELGAEIVTDSPVTALRFEGERAVGVEVGGEVRRHDHVVINADATWAMKNLMPEDVRRRAGGAAYTDSTIDAKKYSCSTYMMYLGVEGDVDLPHHTIYISGRYRENLDEIVSGSRLSEDPSVYVCNPSRIDPSLAPAGGSSLYVLAPTPNTRAGIDWRQEGAGMRERVLDQIEAKLGVRDIRGRIRAEVRLSPEDWRGANINFGATFNLAHNLGQMLHLRPQNKLKGFDNVYLVGGGTHPGSGLPTIFLSAQISSRMLCERAGVAFAGDLAAARAGEPAPAPPVAVGAGAV
jgi:phytoene desaturase